MDRACFTTEEDCDLLGSGLRELEVGIHLKTRSSVHFPNIDVICAH